jgi:hypothetical protein
MGQERERERERERESWKQKSLFLLFFSFLFLWDKGLWALLGDSDRRRTNKGKTERIIEGSTCVHTEGCYPTQKQEQEQKHDPCAVYSFSLSTKDRSLELRRAQIIQDTGEEMMDG